MIDVAGSNYAKYRGKCREMSEAAVAADPTLRLVRGYYHEPMWGTKEQHWWCVRQDGTIFDPTRLQFPSGGVAELYEEFDGNVECAECGRVMPEAEAQIDGRYAFCGYECYGKFVGF